MEHEENVIGLPLANLLLFRTILNLVYTALKLCMDINPVLFDECANHYKIQRQLYVSSIWKGIRDS